MKKLLLFIFFGTQLATAQQLITTIIEKHDITRTEKDNKGIKILCPDSVGFANPSCHGGANGYFRPDYGDFKTPTKRQLYILTDTGWVALYSELWEEIGPCGLRAGTYKWEVTDSLNVVHTYTAVLTQPAAASVSIVQSGNFNACNGTLTANVNGGVLPYKYRWDVSLQNTPTTTISSTGPLCEVPVRLIVYEGNNIFCGQVFYFHTGPAGLENIGLEEVRVKPNPFTSTLQFLELPSGSTVRIFTVNGELVQEEITRNVSLTLNLAALNSGLYFYTIVSDKGLLSGKIIKQ